MNRKIHKYAIIAIVMALILTIGTFQTIVSPVSAQPSEREETLYVAMTKKYPDPTNFNIYVPGSGSRSGRGSHQLIHEYFFYVNLETGEYIPWLAEDYEYSPDYTSIKVYLRRGVKWSDGYPFTADDVVFTYDLLLKYSPKLIWSPIVEDWVDHVEKIDDYTVKIFLKTANPRFHLIREAFPVVRIWGGLTILPKHVWEGKDPLEFKDYPPTGTGPYRLVSAAETVMIYERRDDWWVTEQFGVRPAPKYIYYQNFGPEDVVAARLAMNDIDSPAIGILSLGTFHSVREKNPNVRAWYVTSPYAWLDPCPRLFFIQNAKYPWSLPEVRRAISYLIDRDVISKIAYEGVTVPSWGMFPYYGGLKPYFDAIKDLIKKYEPTKYDPVKAEKIFTDLGFKKVDGIWVTPNGTRLEMTYVVNPKDAEDMKVQAVTVDQLRAGGIDVTVKPITGPPLADAMLRGDYDMRYHCMCPGDTDPFDNLDLFHSKHWRPLGEPCPWYEANSFRYKNPAYDKILNKLAAIPPTDLEKCIELFRGAMEILFEDFPVLPGMQAPALVPFNYYYWIGWPSADDPWNMPVNWWATFNLVINGYKSTITGEWVGGIRPRTIEHATVYFTKDTPKFRGIDLAWYGPFESGDSARIPADDAEFWIRKGYASYTPPVVVPPEIPAIAKAVEKLLGDVSDLKTSVAEGISATRGEVEALRGQMSTLVAVATIEGIAIVALAVALVFIMRRKPA